jgi:hypothetical protein
MTKSLITNITEKYDNVIDIRTLVMNPTNLKMYQEYEKDYISNLSILIRKEGLKNPIVLYKDRYTIKSGHNRLLACKELGEAEVPVIISNEEKPTSVLQEMVSLAIENMGRPANMGRSYRSVKSMIEAFSTENDGKQPNTSEIKQYCSMHQIGYDSYTKLGQLELTHPNLFKKVIDGKMSLTAAVNETKILSNAVSLSKTPFMESMVGNQELNYAISRVTGVMSQLPNIKVMMPDGTQVSAFESDDIQAQTMGGIVHELFTNAVRDVVNHKNGELILTAPKNSKEFDLEAINYNSGIETKTCVTEQGKKPKFVGHRYKDSYTLLLSLTPNRKRAFAGYGIITADCWKPGKPVGTLDMKKLSECQTFNIIIGEIEADGDKVTVNHDKIMI